MQKFEFRRTIFAILVILSIFLFISTVGAAAPQINKTSVNADGTIDVYFDQKVTAGSNLILENIQLKDANGNIISANGFIMAGPEVPVYSDRVTIFFDNSQLKGNKNIELTIPENMVKNKDGEYNTKDKVNGQTPFIFSNNIWGQIIAGITKLFTNPVEFFNDLFNSNPKQIKQTQQGTSSSSSNNGSTSSCSTSSGSSSSGSSSSGSSSSGSSSSGSSGSGSSGISKEDAEIWNMIHGLQPGDPGSYAPGSDGKWYEVPGGQNVNNMPIVNNP